jgi:outer membrane protein TolC
MRPSSATSPASLPPRVLPAIRNRFPGALEVARSVNPSILAATHVQLAQEHAVEVTKGDLLPSASIEAAAGVTGQSG